MVPKCEGETGLAALGAALGPLMVPKLFFESNNEPTVSPNRLQDPKMTPKMSLKVQKMTPTMAKISPKVLLKANQ